MMKLELTFRPAKEGGNLPLSFHLVAPQVSTPLLECGFAQENPEVRMHRRGDGEWIGDANIHGSLRGTALLSIILKDVSAPHRYWKGALSLEFAGKIGEQLTVNVVGVKNEGDKGGMGQANSVHINLHQPEVSHNGSHSDASWQRVEVALIGCETVPMPIPPPTRHASTTSIPVSHAAVPNSPTTSQRATTPLPDQPGQAASTSSNHIQNPQEPSSNKWEKKLIVSVAGTLGVILTFFAWNRGNTQAKEQTKDPVIIINNNNGDNNSIQGGQFIKTADAIPSHANQTSTDNPVPDAPKLNTPPSTPVPSTSYEANKLPKDNNQPKPQSTLRHEDEVIEIRGIAEVYKSGAALRFEVRLAQPGYVRLQTCDPAGEPSQLYPSQHDVIREFPAGKWMPLPDPNLLVKYPNALYECYLPEGKTRETTNVRLQWSPFPFEKTGLREAGEFFYEPSQPTTWTDIATRGVRLKLNKPAVESKELTFEVVP